MHVGLTYSVMPLGLLVIWVDKYMLFSADTGHFCIADVNVKIGGLTRPVELSLLYPFRVVSSKSSLNSQPEVENSGLFVKMYKSIQVVLTMARVHLPAIVVFDCASYHYQNYRKDKSRVGLRWDYSDAGSDLE